MAIEPQRSPRTFETWALLPAGEARYLETGTIRKKEGSSRPTKITAAVKQLVETQMRLDDETTAVQLFASLATILRARTILGWTFRGSGYCQLIRDANKIKRQDWANANLHGNFEDVIWSDECSVQMESHRRTCCRKIGEPPRPKPRPKHPAKVHVWAGISLRGRTAVCIFEGIMDATLYTSILDATLIPFMNSVYPGGHRFMQDNDPKHTSRHAANYMRTNGVNWWKTPPESPDCNPIEENLWHELKEFLRREIKPKTKQELIDGIQTFWRTVTIAKCGKYIGHLKKVIPKVIELQGAATGY